MLNTDKKSAWSSKEGYFMIFVLGVICISIGECAGRDADKALRNMIQISSGFNADWHSKHSSGLL